VASAISPVMKQPVQSTGPEPSVVAEQRRSESRVARPRPIQVSGACPKAKWSAGTSSEGKMIRVFRKRWGGCAYCLYRRIHLIRGRWFDRPLGVLRLRRYRCEHCQQRFWRFL
jgi:hypothetical protein